MPKDAMHDIETYRGIIHGLLSEYRDFLADQTHTDKEINGST